jgi:hypothetical protein
VIDDTMAFLGWINPRQFPSPSITIRPDCVGEFAGGPLNPAKIYAASDGTQFVVLNWFPGTIVSGWYRKQ